jgi:pimeloyl-ACP methyl ester carboxylesterase
MALCSEETVYARGRKVRRYRGGTGPQLLFLHDPFCFAWLPIHEKLAARLDVVLPIHPGFAGSEESFAGFEEMEDLVFHDLDLCAALGLERPVLVGASFGGWIAAEWALRYSESLSKLILVDALGLRVNGAPAPDVLGLDGAALRRTLFSDANSAPALETLPDMPRDDEMVGTILARRTLARFAWQFPDNPRLRRYLYRIKVPTQIIWGERDGWVAPAHGRVYQKGITGSKFTTIPNSGHLPHVEAQAACADIILDFLVDRSA